MTPLLRTGVTIVVLALASVDPHAYVLEATRRAIASPRAVTLPEDLTSYVRAIATPKMQTLWALYSTKISHLARARSHDQKESPIRPSERDWCASWPDQRQDQEQAG